MRGGDFPADMTWWDDLDLLRDIHWILPLGPRMVQAGENTQDEPYEKTFICYDCILGWDVDSRYPCVKGSKGVYFLQINVKWSLDISWQWGYFQIS